MEHGSDEVSLPYLARNVSTSEVASDPSLPMLPTPFLFLVLPNVALILFFLLDVGLGRCFAVYLKRPANRPRRENKTTKIREGVLFRGTGALSQSLSYCEGCCSQVLKFRCIIIVLDASHFLCGL